MTEDSKRKAAKVLTTYGEYLGVEPSASALLEEAIRYRVLHPEPVTDSEVVPKERSKSSAELELASEYVGTLAQRDPERAAEWLQTLPDGDAKWWAAKNLHVLWSNFDPQAANRWKSLLPVAQQKAVDALPDSDE